MALDINTLNKLSTAKKVIILVVLTGIIGSVYYFVFYKKMEAKLETQKTSLNKVWSERASLKAIADDLDNYKEQVEKLKIRFKEALQKLPDSKEIDTLLSNVNKKGEESGLEFLLFKPLPEVPKQFYAEVPVKMTVTGDYLDLATFFYKISNLKRIINVKSINIKAMKEVDGKMLLTTSCVATTFKFLKPSDAKKKKGAKKKRKKKK